MIKHYNYFRSGTSHRLRIALNLKGIETEYIAVDLASEAHLKGDFSTINPQALVPALVLDDGEVLTQSPAIIEWLEERFPSPPLLPKDIQERAHVRALAALVGCDIHPVNNRRILEYLRHNFGADNDTINAWCGRWITAGFDAYEKHLANQPKQGKFSCGNTPTVADVYLIPQIESARRFKVDLSQWPLIQAIDRACAALDAFAKAAPQNQVDFK